MNVKKTFQSIITLKQQEFPTDLISRELELPIDSGHIITVPGVRRCGKSSLMELVVNRLIAQGKRPITCHRFINQ